MSLEQIKNKKKNKKRSRLIYRTAILLVMLGAIIFAIASNLMADNTLYRVGDQAPNFQLTQINKHNEAEVIELNELRGKGVMLNFWATWCKPCEREMPYMQELYPKYKEKGIEIVAISLDSTELVVDRFIEKHNLTFPIPHDKYGEIRDLYKVGPLPSTFFISPEGEIVEFVSGELSLERLEGYFERILPDE